MSRTNHRPKRVRFSQYSTLAVFAPTPKVTKNLWYGSQDMVQFKLDMSLKIFSLRNSTDAIINMENLAHYISGCDAAITIVKPPETTFKIEVLGIEHLVSPDLLRFMLHKRRSTISSVIREQYQQRAIGTRDELQLAAISSLNSKFSRSWAAHIGRNSAQVFERSDF